MKNTTTAAPTGTQEQDSRDHAGRWRKGVSGNPQGRRREAHQLREQLAEHCDEVLEAIVTAAKAGDMVAARIVIDRVLPALKPQAAPVALPVADSTPHEAYKAILQAVAAGELDASRAADMLDFVASAQHRIKHSDPDNWLNQALADL